jgi:hypothetical protein
MMDLQLLLQLFLAEGIMDLRQMLQTNGQVKGDNLWLI